MEPDIHPDIREAKTPPAEFYTSEAAFAEVREKVLARAWHFIGDDALCAKPATQHPFSLLPGCLDEPLLLSRGRDNSLRCMSNVCTHRGTILVEKPGEASGSMRCRYHGRQFSLDGVMKHMPEFEGCKHFPSKSDNLAQVPLARWRQFLFAGVAPSLPFDRMIAEVERRVGWMPIEKFRFDAARSREYTVKAHFALYCDNYLEGFHVPFVHAALNEALDYSAYTTELFEQSSLQLGIAKSGEPCFDVPASAPDAGKRVAGYYFWLFPCTMLNFYPWGLSVNVVQPISRELTRVKFLSYVWDESKISQGAGADLHRVELEDEAVVEAVAAGLKGRFYKRGRYSPTRETGTHHFHRLLAAHL
jgi:choline monooxygenase